MVLDFPSQTNEGHFINDLEKEIPDVFETLTADGRFIEVEAGGRREEVVIIAGRYGGYPVR